MPDQLDAVAQAIFDKRYHHEPVHSWTDLYSDEQDRYRAMAQAAIDALGLTEEWRCVGWVFTRDEDAAQKQHAANGGEIHSRLVSGWVRKDSSDE